MTKLVGVFLYFVLLFSCRDAIAAAPPQLYGKSVILSWTYNLTLRPAGTQAPFHSESVSHQMSIYVSTAGRLFMRHAATSRGGSGAFDRVRVSGSGESYLLQFQGSSLIFRGTAHGAVEGAAALQLRIAFTPGFGGCTANVILGKGTGAATYTLKSVSTGKMIEVQSASASGASCSIKDGNVFAGE